MALGHEKLDVYRLAISYVAWVYEKAARLEGVHRAARDQWLRASQSIPLNIAEGNGKTADADRRRYFEIARGSALECAAIQDVLVVGKTLDETESQKRKAELDRMAAMLSRLGGRGYQVRESEEAYAEETESVDTDPDSDLDETTPQQGGGGDGTPPPHLQTLGGRTMKPITAIMICLYLTSCTKKSDVGGEDPLAASEMRAQAPHAVELGWQYFNKGDYGTAMRRFQMAVRHDPSHAPAYYGIAYVYSVQNELDDAIKYYRLTLEHDQTYPYTFANLGYALLQNNETEEGLRMLDKALQLKPDCGEAHLSYASYYASKQQWRKAQESANSAIKCGLVIHPELKKLLEANGVKLIGPQKNSDPGDTPPPQSPSAQGAGGR